MSDFHTLSIKKIVPQTPNAIAVYFDVPEHLHTNFQFVAGQYITLKTVIDGEEIRRSYSLCSMPGSQEWAVVIKRIENGKFSSYALANFTEGMHIEVSEPEGRFTLNPNAKNICTIAVGSGITPIMAMIKDTLHQHNEAQVALIYGNKSEEETIFAKELTELKSQFPERFHPFFTYTKTQPIGHLFGRIERSTINFVLKNKLNHLHFDQFLLCGPQDMIDKVQDLLIENGIDKTNIHYELFTSTADFAPLPVNNSEMVKVTVMVDQVETTFEMPRTQDILSAALKKGIDAPYSCQGGICSSCMCRTKKGHAEMKTNHILMDDEVEAGLLLACQAYVTTDDIYVDFDDV